MKITWFMTSLILLTSINVYAYNTDAAYEDYNKNISSGLGIVCSAPGLKQTSIEQRKNQTIYTYKMKDLEFNIVFDHTVNKKTYALQTYNQEISINGYSRNTWSDIYFYYPSDLDQYKKDILLNAGLILERTDKRYKRKMTISCIKSHGLKEKISLESNSYHFIYHPHEMYDIAGLTKNQTIKHLENPNTEKILFLDEYIQPRFYRVWSTSRKYENWRNLIMNFPQELNAYVSPMNKARRPNFKFSQKDIDILYTGSYLNMGIIKHAKNVVLDYLQGRSEEGNLNITFDLNALMLQKNGVINKLDYKGGFKLGSEAFIKPKHKKAYLTKLVHYMRKKLLANSDLFHRINLTMNMNKERVEILPIQGNLKNDGVININVNFVN